MPFKPGHSGNPAGRKHKTDGERKVQSLAREHTDTAIRKLAAHMESDDARASIAACVALLDRGWGKPAQTIDATVTKHIVTDERLIAARNSLRRAQEPENRTVQ